jgi:hypothetical protein
MRELTSDEKQYNLIATLVYSIFSDQAKANEYTELLKYNYVPHGGFNTDMFVMNSYIQDSQEYIPDQRYFVSVKQIEDARAAAAEKMNRLQQNSRK